MAPPDAVLFDVNETLVSFAPLQAVFTDLGLAPDRQDAWWRGVLVDGIATAAADRPIAFVEAMTHHLEAEFLRLGRTTPPDAAARVLATVRAAELQPDVAAALTLLAERGVRAVPFTNGSAAIAQGALARAGLGALVEDCWDVGEVGRWKPAAAPYRWACDRLELPPARVALIAVHPWDVMDAMAAGLRGAWTDRAGHDHWPTHLPAPDARGPSLEAALRALLDGERT
ncbi:MAG: HAD family hydrolase [Nitriliruptoraceae bacterium]|nr:HAD family hydrolase [Nitriliruptoraceae bacterium]